MDLHVHPQASQLHEHERRMAELLLASDLAVETLPFRLDAKIGYGVLTAAECAVLTHASPLLPTDERILLVCEDYTIAEMWASMWQARGLCSVELADNGGPGPFQATCISQEKLAWYEEELSTQRYALLVLWGIEDAQAAYAQMAVKHERLWRVLSQGEAFDESRWPVGPAGHSLFQPVPWSKPLSLGTRARPSALAERACLSAA